ncbi:MAG: tRNA adenosine(34) deaminase TadA [Clostridia bacterium]|nr:tRNA adenosine(34) deaminase TadA [Clostridia bacterium]
MEQDIHFMRQALALAQEAADEWETPVGALIVRNGEVIAAGRNRREIGKNALYHAEIEAIDNACKKLGGWRLPGCTLYVTLEPCPMCTGAIINSRIERVVFGASDLKAGSMGSVIDLTELPYNHKPAVERGILQEECAGMLSSFFKALRKHKEKKNENSCH